MQVQDPYQTQNRKNLTWLACGIVLLVVAALGFSSGWLQVFGRQPLQATRVGGNVPPPSLLDPGSSTAMMTLDQGTPAEPLTRDEAKSMPKDVYDWLKHLERIERERKRMSTAQAAELSVAMTKLSLGGAADMLKGLFGEEGDGEEPPLPTEAIVSGTEQKREDWAKLIQDFRSYPPPTECAAAAASYDEALSETRTMMMEVLDSVALAQESPERAIEALTNMQGKSADRIDVAGQDTDAEVQRICDKYETRKWFSINSDFAGGLMNSVPSLPGR